MIAKLRLSCIYCLFLKWILISPVFSQQLPDSAFYRLSLDSFRENYKAESGPNARIYTGAEYIRNGQRAKGSAFFQSDDPLTGSVYYHDALYTNVEMQYDLVIDGVIISDFSGGSKIKLTNEKLSYFSILDHHFLYFAPGRSASSSMKTGFYEILYEGSVSLYGRYEKQLIFPSNHEDELKYDELDFYFLKINDVFYKVDSKGSLLDLLKDKKDLLKKYIRENKLSFKSDLREPLVKSITYYAQLKN
jgi:hypothetical protein